MFTQPVDRTQSGRNILQHDRRQPWFAGYRPSARPSKWPRPAMAATSTVWDRCSINVRCTRRSSGRKPSNRWKWAGEYPDMVIGCVGGGSNFGGIALPFVKATSPTAKRPHHRRRPSSAVSDQRPLCLRTTAITAMMAPIVKMYTLGHTFVA